jgi:hypothetical protein
MSMTTSSLLTQLKQESPLEVSTCGGCQEPIKETPWLPFELIAPWCKNTIRFGPIHTLVRTKMKQLGGGGMPQDSVYADFPKNKLHKTIRLV